MDTLKLSKIMFQANLEHSNFDWMLFFGIFEESYDIT